MSNHKFLLSCSLALLLASGTLPAAADATVKVKLWDKGGIMDLSKSMGLGMNMHGDLTKAIMGIEISKKSVPAGKVTFDVTNASAETIHEMIISAVNHTDVTLPFVESDSRVDEDAFGDLGEVSELDPGKSGKLTLDLKPGLYILYCNVPGHYMAGMWTTVEVK